MKQQDVCQHSLQAMWVCPTAEQLLLNIKPLLLYIILAVSGVAIPLIFALDVYSNQMAVC